MNTEAFLYFIMMPIDLNTVLSSQSYGRRGDEAGCLSIAPDVLELVIGHTGFKFREMPASASQALRLIHVPLCLALCFPTFKVCTLKLQFYLEVYLVYIEYFLKITCACE